VSFRRFSVSIVMVLVVLGVVASAQVEVSTATVPRLIRINGSARDEAGKPLAGNHGITFTLYQDEAGQLTVWQETQNLPLDSAGRFSVLLGATNEAGLPLEIFSAGAARWLGIRPDGQAEQPRILLLSVAYALKAADTEMLGGRPASAYLLAETQNTPMQSASGQATPQILNPGQGTILMSPVPQTACSSITSDGTATANQITKFTTACNIENSTIYESGSNVGIGNTSPAAVLDVSGTAIIRGSLSALAGAVMPPTGTATTSQGYVSNPLDIEASLYNSSLSKAATYVWRWEAEPSGNDSSDTNATLNLLYGVTGDLVETGVSVANTGVITFASGQTFPGAGNGTVTSVATGAGLTGGPITKTGTISIPSAGVTNAMLANPSVTITAGSGLSGGGTVALGNTITLTNTAPSLGGTVTSVASGTGLTGGPITSSGTLSLNTTYTNGLYLQLAGGTLTGALSGTSAAFSGALSGSTGTFSGIMSAAGALLPDTGTATASKGFISNPFDLQASSYSSKSAAAVTQDFRWQAEPTGNDTSSPSGSLNLLFGSNGTAPAETGFSIASTGLVSFASGQTFPGTGNGTVTNVATGAGLTGGPITGTGTISIPSAGVTNTMLANPSVTITAGAGLSGGGTVALGNTITLTNTAPSLGGTVTSVSSGTGLSGGPITSSGSLSLNTSYTNGLYLQLLGGTLTGALSGTSAAFSGALSASTGTFSGTVSEAGAVLPDTGTATASKGFISNPFDFQASAFSSKTSAAVTQDFRWQAEPTGNDTSSPSGSLNLLFGSNGTAPAETGLTIASNGLVTFASGQTFPGSGGSGTVTSVATGAGLTGGPITGTGTISIPSAGVTNTMLANNSVTITAGSGLSGGGSVPLGGTITLTNSAPSLGGTVTDVATGAGLTGGPITGTGTISIPSAGVTNTMLANNSVTITAGSGLSGGGSVPLGGTITLTNSAPSLGGTVTSVSSGTGLTGGPITSSGSLSLNTSYTNGLYLQLLGGTLTGALSGTSAAFSGGVSASTGMFSGTVSEAGAVLPDTSTATATQGFNSNPFDLQASAFSSTTAAAVTQDFRWQAEPAGNDTSSPSGTLNLLFGSNGTSPAETGLSIASNGQITFASGQTFPGGSGSGTVTSVATGAGLTGGPITSTGTISIPPAGVTNSMLANNFVTIAAGSGLSGGGTVALGGTVTLTNTASGGTVTSVATGAGLTGGPITSTGTISIPAAGITNGMLANNSVTIAAGSGLSGGGTVALGGTVTLASNLSGTPDGIAYFSNPTSLVSTPAPTNGQVLIGSTGTVPALGTLTAGQNINITNGPGSVTISALGGGTATLPFFVTGGQHTGGTQATTANVTKLWGFLLPYNVTTTQVTYDVATADNTTHDYDIGIFDNSGNLVLDIGPTPGTAFAPAKAFETLAWTQGSTSLAAGRYYLAITTNCTTACAKVEAATTYVSFAIGLSAGASAGGALPTTITPPADVWSTGAQPTVVIH
jgi:hypothetical protein